MGILRKNILKLIFLICICFQVQFAQAQYYRISKEVDLFAGQVDTLLKSTRVPSAEKSGSDFVSTFNNLNAEQKQKTIDLFQDMNRRNYSAFPHFSVVANLLNLASQENIGPNRISQLIETTHKTLVNYTSDRFTKTIQGLALFVEKKVFFENKFLRTKVISDKYSFAFEGGKPILDTAKPVDYENYFLPPTTADPNEENPPLPEMDDLGNMIPGQKAQPMKDGPVIVFESLDWIFSTPYDSLGLSGTKGYYLVDKGIFVGEEGKFDLSTLGIYQGNAVVAFKKYNFKVNEAYLYSDLVTLNYADLSDKPVDGTFEYRSVARRTPESNPYPKFKSYFAKYNLKGLPEGVSIRGGLSLDGKAFSSANFFETPSEIRITEKGRLIFKGKGLNYEAVDSIIKASETSSVFYYGKDSISQPGAKMLYNSSAKILRLFTDKGKFEGSPFLDTYHRVEVIADEIRLNHSGDSAKIDFLITSANNMVPAMIESIDFYDRDMLGNLQGYSDINPVIMLMAHYVKNKSDQIYLSELDPRFTKNMAQLNGSLQTIASRGFIYYDQKRGLIRLKDKIKHYYDSKKDRKDFDLVSIPSISPNRPNASKNLLKEQLDINGVEQFTISDSLDVYIIPKEQELRMLKDRDILFDGKINAGIFLTHGKSFKFDYQNFKVSLDDIDSISLRLPPKRDSTGKLVEAFPVKLENQRHGEAKDLKEGEKLSKTKGTLFINKPNNKSGRKKFPQYPIFDVVDFSYVYFDAPHILGGVYNEDIFFKVPPFQIDSTASTNLSAISFDGTFHSDNIFPDFEENLKIQEDRSLGFKHKTPPTGYKLYNGVGTFFGEISLNNNGIRGKGEIKYLTASIKSDDFIFYQDSVTAKGDKFTLKENKNEMGNFPDAETESYTMKWLPKKDSLIVKNDQKKGPFNMYRGTTTLDGQLVLYSGGVRGGGILKRTGSEVESKNMTFELDNFYGREANFKIASENPDKPAVKSTNVKFNYDLVNKKAEFETEVSGFASNEFPYTQFKTSIPKATWDFEAKTVSMSKPDSIELANSIFYSTLPELDSIYFSASSAVYDLTNYELKVMGVPHINIADAEIAPDSGKVSILENAQIVPLRNATIVVDTIKRYHRLVEANVQIVNRHKFNGDGLYQYVNIDRDTLPINFREFNQLNDSKKKKQARWYTTGKGKVEEAKPLTISPGVLFKGNVYMVAMNRNLEFDGEVAVDLRNSGERTWVRYVKKGDDRDFSIDLKGAKNAAGQAMVTGLFTNEGTPKIYGVFIDTKKGMSDRPILLAEGRLKTNLDSREYLVGSVDKMDGKSLEGNVFGYNDSTKRVSFDGRLNLITGVQDKNITLLAAGKGTGIMEPTAINAQLLMHFDFMVPEPAMKSMQGIVYNKVREAGLAESRLATEDLLTRIGDAFGAKLAEDYKKQSAQKYTPIFVPVSRAAKGINFTDVNLKWSDEHNAWYSVGKVSLGSINRTDLNVSVDAFIEIERLDKGENINLYLKPTEDTWYFFRYTPSNRLSAMATDNVFNTEVAVKSKAKTAGKNYAFQLAEDEIRVLFLKDFHRKYLGKEIEVEPFTPVIGVPKPESAEPVPGENVEGGQEEGGSTATPSSELEQPKKAEPKGEPEINPLTGEPIPSATPSQQAQPEAKPAEKPKEQKKPKEEKKKEPKKPVEEAKPQAAPQEEEPEINPITGEVIPKEKKSIPEPSKKTTPDSVAKSITAPDSVKNVEVKPQVDSTEIKAKLKLEQEAKKAADEKAAKEKLEAEKKAAEEKAAKEKAEADKKAAEEKAAADRKAAEEAKKKEEEEKKKKEEEEEFDILGNPVKKPEKQTEADKPAEEKKADEEEKKADGN